jgi:uncharacterized integral membrane protein
LSGAARSAASILRRTVAVLVLLPLAVVIVAFAVANRQEVTVSFDPFSSGAPAASVTLPLFGLILAVLILGVVIGGVTGWLRHGGWRRAARRLDREVSELRSEIDALKGVPAGGQKAPEPAEPPERLRLRVPVR